MLFKIRNTCFRPTHIQPLVEKGVEFINSMNFNKDKCQVLHLEQNSQRAQYMLTPVWLGSCLDEKDGGSWWTPSQQESTVPCSSRTKSDMGCIPRGITSRGRDMIIPLHSVLARLHLQHCAPFWSPQFKEDADRLERAQRSIMKMLKTSTTVLKGQVQRGWRLSLHKEPHGQDQGQKIQTAPVEVSSRHKKEIS